MDNQRPRGREKNISGPGKSVQKRGDGLHTGPVGDTGGRGGEGQQSGGTRSGGTRSGGGIKLIILLLVALLGGGGGIGALLSGQSGGQNGSQTDQPSQSGVTTPDAGVNLSSLLSGLNAGSVSSGWQGEINTGRLDTTVASGARPKYTTLLGSGRDTATVMVYMCGTDLESRSGMGTADLQEMLAANFGDNINLLVYTGGCKGWRNDLVSSSTNQVWQVKGGKMFCLEKDLGSSAMTEPANLTYFIQWCAQNYRASRYELIFWDHGGGSVSGYGYDEKFASSGSMDLAEIDAALTKAGVKFDFIGFDACLMATVETALMLTEHADYLIASEETEPGVGWYYTDWLTAFGQNPSMPTIEIGKQIVDSFVDVCAQKCRGQLTTLSVIDLAELDATVPKALTAFSQSASGLLQAGNHQAVADARVQTREFAQSSKIDQVDLVHLAQNIGTPEGQALAQALLGAVKYNRTSSNMTNAYGVSIYFPYQKTSTVDRAVSLYREVGMDDAYSLCIRQFASMHVSGQAASGGAASPLPALLGTFTGGSGSSDAISQVLSGFLSGNFGSVSGLTGDNTGFLSDRALNDEETSQYLAEHWFDAGKLVWSGDETPVLRLSGEQWRLVQSLELNLFYDDGEGYIDLGLDNVYEFDENGALLGTCDGTWLAIDGQPVAYYHTATVDDGENYAITGRVPVLHNGQRAELILVFDNERPYGYVAGVQSVYTGGETETVAKSDGELLPGDTVEFLCDYYSYDGEYLDSYLLGDPLTVTEEALTISNVPLEGGVLQATYRFTDFFNQHYWTPAMP